MTTTIDTITTEQITQLRREAATAGDMEQVELCDRAIAEYVQDADKPTPAMVACLASIREAEARTSQVDVIDGMTPDQAWDKYVGDESPASWGNDEPAFDMCADYVDASPMCDDLLDHERLALAYKLAAHLEQCLSAADAQSPTSTDRVEADTLVELAEAAEEKWGATVIVRNDRGNGSAGPVALLIAELVEYKLEEDLEEVMADQDPEAWRLAREAHDALKIEPPCQVWVGEEQHPGEYLSSNPAQAIYSV